jgi:hypothetical protein
VLLAGESSLANVGGRIVRLGDAVDGHRLVSVSEDGALFEHAGHTLHVPLQGRRAPAEPGDAD